MDTLIDLLSEYLSELLVRGEPLDHAVNVAVIFRIDIIAELVYT